jgi:hypothetical protein
MQLKFKGVERISRNVLNELLEGELAKMNVVGNAIVQTVGEGIIRVTQLVVDFDSRSEPQEMKNKIIAVCKKYGFEGQ